MFPPGLWPYAASKILGQPIMVVNKTGGRLAVAMASPEKRKTRWVQHRDPGRGGFLVPLRARCATMCRRTLPRSSSLLSSNTGWWCAPILPGKPLKTLSTMPKPTPGKSATAPPGSGGAQHLVMERLAMKEKIKWTHHPLRKRRGGGHGPPGRIMWKRLPRLPPGKSMWMPDASGFWPFYGEKRMSELSQRSNPAGAGVRYYRRTQPHVLWWVPRDFPPKWWKPSTRPSKKPWRTRISSG